MNKDITQAIYYRNSLPWWIRHHLSKVGSLPVELVQKIEHIVMKKYYRKHRCYLEMSHEDFYVKTKEVRATLEDETMMKTEVSNGLDLTKLRQVRYHWTQLLEYHRLNNGSWRLSTRFSKYICKQQQLPTVDVQQSQIADQS